MGNLFSTKDDIVRECSFPEKVSFQGNRYRAHLKSLRLDDDLLEYIQECDIFNCKENELENKGFKRCVDYPMKPKHIYYEGYFHGMTQSEDVPSINPRNWADMDKPAGPNRIRAYLQAFRELNNFGSLVELLPDGILKDYLEKSWHFSDLAVQIHYGDEISNDFLGWHADAPNSMLHLATSIRNCRGLHYEIVSEDENGARESEQSMSWQNEGDAYLSSPFAFRHAVEFPRSYGYTNRIISMQARFLLTQEGIPEKAAMPVITKWLEEHEIVLPTLAQVLEQEALLP